MQIFEAALKVAITWKQNCNFNHNPYNRSRHHNSNKPSKMMSKTEETGSSGDPMDIDDGKIDTPPFLSSVDLADGEDTSLLSSSEPHMFSEVVALAKNLVFYSDDDENEVNVDVDVMVNEEDEFKMHLEDNAIDDKLDVPIIDLEEEQSMLLLETYGRKCTLPFLRFAALLKKYINGDGEDSLNENQDPSTFSSQINSPSSADELPRNKNFPNCHKWSREDYEYLTLACYLKLINYDEETFEVCDCCEGVDKSDSCTNNEDHNPHHENTKYCMPFQPPSAMEAVIWPQWAYSTLDMSDNVSTVISRAWFASFRQALTARIPKATIIFENTNVTPAALDIDPNSSANIMIAARLLLAIDCCNGGVSNYNYNTNENSDSISDRGLRMLPTIDWTGPRLLKLPHCYDDVFEFYHARQCHRCDNIPRETSLCLICGTVVCLKENCCRTNDIFEAVQVS